MNTSVLIKYIGSPYVDSKIKLSEDELKDVYELAFKNRVALLLLSKHYSKDWKGFALDKYKMLKNREDKTLEVVVRLANKLSSGSLILKLCSYSQLLKDLIKRNNRQQKKD